MMFQKGSITWKGCDRVEIVVVRKHPNGLAIIFLISREQRLRKYRKKIERSATRRRLSGTAKNQPQFDVDFTHSVNLKRKSQKWR